MARNHGNNERKVYKMSQITKKITINAPVERVWEVLADIGGIANWAPQINHAVTTTEGNPGVGSERQCDVAGFGTVTERFVEWEDGSHFTYEVSNVALMKLVRNTTSVHAAGDQSLITLTMNFWMKFGPLGAPMIPIARILMSKQGKLGLAGLKYHVETGELVGTKLPKAATKSA